jgi:hypothetical protein
MKHSFPPTHHSAIVYIQVETPIAAGATNMEACALAPTDAVKITAPLQTGLLI